MNGCPYCKDFNPHWNSVVKIFPKIKTIKIERRENPKNNRKIQCIFISNNIISIWS